MDPGSDGRRPGILGHSSSLRCGRVSQGEMVRLDIFEKQAKALLAIGVEG
jgi:hypothetical protein